MTRLYKLFYDQNDDLYICPALHSPGSIINKEGKTLDLHVSRAPHSSSSVHICTRVGDEHAHIRVAGTHTYVHLERTFETYVFIPNVRSKRTFILRTYVLDVRLYMERTFLFCYKRLAIRKTLSILPPLGVHGPHARYNRTRKRTS